MAELGREITQLKILGMYGKKLRNKNGKEIQDFFIEYNMIIADTF